MGEILRVDTISDYYDWLDTKPMNPLISIVDYSKLGPGIPARKLYGFYAVFLKDVKCGDLKYGMQSYDYQDGTLLFVSPGQVYGSDNVKTPIQGSGLALLFHPDLLNGTSLGKKMREYTFFSYNSNEALHVSEKERRLIQNCLDQIEYELSLPEDKYSKQIVVSSLQMFLDYCSRFYDRQFTTRETANMDLLTKLESLIDNYFHSGEARKKGFPTVKYCAAELNLSANYLSDLLRKETGNSALNYIHSKLIELAKTELTTTDKTINEIAYSLGFEYPPHFTRMFKKYEGVTPTEYRKKVM